MKSCSKCKINKENEEYYVDNRISSGLSSSCKECHMLKRKKLRENEYIRYYHIKRRYNITKKDYDDLLEKQDNKCSLCKSVNQNYFNRSDKLVIDHCHISGKIRGLLCSPCNVLLGNIEKLGSDNIQEYINTISIYLKKS